MVNTRTEMPEARQLGSPQQSSGGSMAAGAGRHRGPAAAESGQEPPHGKHRRPAGE
ncbi:hypothetical protein ACMA1D_04045 [Streptomyces sp. 796.1]|uniref:hypothetical protein n=1 Tax=Streptomyces sp. 796.1 TaxID=3163029 RepID=UPI0039C9A7D6